jgi:hypothetical protein
MQVRRTARGLLKTLGAALLGLALIPMLAPTADAARYRGRGWGGGWGRGVYRYYAAPYRGYSRGYSGYRYGYRGFAPRVYRPGAYYGSGYRGGFYGGAYPYGYGGFAAPRARYFNYAPPML